MFDAWVGLMAVYFALCWLFCSLWCVGVWLLGSSVVGAFCALWAVMAELSVFGIV